MSVHNLSLSFSDCFIAYFLECASVRIFKIDVYFLSTHSVQNIQTDKKLSTIITATTTRKHWIQCNTFAETNADMHADTQRDADRHNTFAH